MGGNTPLFNKNGRYLGPTGKIGFWFNLPFDDWVYVYSDQGPPSSNKEIPVILLGEGERRGAVLLPHHLQSPRRVARNLRHRAYRAQQGRCSCVPGD